MAELAKRLENLGTEGAFEVLARAKALEAQGRRVVHFEIGEPDFDTPENIKKAAYEALEKGYTHYVPAAGIPEVKAAYADYVAKTRNAKVDPDQIVITVGAKPIIYYTMMALVDPGDEVIYPDPGYPIYESAARFAGATLKPIVLREENGFRLDVDELKRMVTPKTKVIVINSPHNPTGSALTKEELKEILALADGQKTFILMDELYHRIYYKGEMAPSMYEFEEARDKVILMEGFSKIYAMTGWRLGYGVLPPALVPWFSRLQTNIYSHAPAFIQVASMEAYRGPQDASKAMVDEFKRRRDYIVPRINSIKGIHCLEPDGAFYIWINIKDLKKPSKEVADYLLNEAGVALLAGNSFGESGEGYIRISYATSMENIQWGLDQMEKALARLV
ncbi:pyridoxal phosphate-dependent aminotransferase [Coprothermobacteraceae bacterium]|nr:pyridoxal phosphate-dependent aminotransferase [Coprothermobacteraceae bacterium]